MNNLLPLFFFLLLILALFINVIGLMRLIPLYLTLPLLFISIYLMLYSMTQKKKVYRRMR
ncbi:hypothetical protein M3210_12615 [Oceanobacillus luteolus]|uniref:Membrane protein YizD n=1 Tax=Oceanobacillus luteolus TaxID=1274358 RepID=A0ABW4HTD2_9BACI|nr:hypothetical protein [Oceanobacillus luteolus]MCM3741113.1 hypothetical protein [Oceanobacillus luteolus]